MLRKHRLLLLLLLLILLVGVVVILRPGAMRRSPTTTTTTTMTMNDVTVTTIDHVLVTGQSLAVGAMGGPPLSPPVGQPHSNLMFRGGLLAERAGLDDFAPLTERTYETMSSSFANSVTTAASTQTTAAMLVSIAAVSGTPYRDLKKGRTPYETGLQQVSAAMALATKMKKTYVFRAIANVHGEAEHQGGNASYDKDLLEWQSDFETDIRARVGGDGGDGGDGPIPMLITQISSWPAYGSATSEIPRQQLEAHKASKGKVILVGAKYHLPYVEDGVHLTAEGYRQMGEDYAKVYRHVVLNHRPWEPLRPTRITRSGKVITVQFIAPVLPILLDETTVSNPGNYGFEYEEEGSAPTQNAIATISVTAADTITIELQADPAPTSAKRLRYAFTSKPGSPAGPKTGPRGNLRDSDESESQFGHRLHNWCVHFDETVP